MWFFVVPSVMKRRRAICRLVAPSPTRWATSASRSESGPEAGCGSAARSVAGLFVILVEEPSHYAGGAGFAGLFEGLPATGVTLVLIAGAWFWLRRGGDHGGREVQSSPSASAPS